MYIDDTLLKHRFWQKYLTMYALTVVIFGYIYRFKVTVNVYYNKY